MWKCAQCNEEIPDNFDVCWRCGTTRDGNTSKDFEAEADDPSVPDPGPNPEAAVFQSSPPDSAEPGCLPLLDIAELACKILALWLIAKFSLSITAILVLLCTAIFRNNPGQVAGTAFISAIFPLGELIVAIVLWKDSKRISRKMASDVPLAVVKTNINREGWLTLAFTVVGIYAVWESMYGTFRILSQVVLESHKQGFNDASFWNDIDWQARVVGQFFSLAFAIWLLIGSRGIVRFVSRTRGDLDSGSDTAVENNENNPNA